MKVKGKAVTRMTCLDPDDPDCGCGAPAVDEFPCGCLLYAAQKKGLPLDAFLDPTDKVEHWKDQYKDLPAFKVPGNELIKMLPPDGLSPLPPVTYPLKAGRPSNARVKGATEQIRKYKRKATAEPEVEGV